MTPGNSAPLPIAYTILLDPERIGDGGGPPKLINELLVRHGRIGSHSVNRVKNALRGLVHPL